MQTNGVDVMMATIPENLLYASGFRSLSQWLIRGQKTLAVAVIKFNGEVTLIAPSGELDRAACDPPVVDHIIAFDTVTVEPGDEAIWLAEDWRYANMVLVSNRPKDLWEAFALAGIPDEACVAIDDPDLAQAYRQRYQTQVTDARPLWLQSRLIKTPEEVNRLRRAVEITEIAFLHTINAVQVGISEKELAIIFNMAVVKAGGDPYLAVIGAGTYGAYPNHIPGDYCIKAGDLIRWDMGCSYQGYVADIARTTCVGKPNKLQTERWEAVLAGQMAALNAIYPGQLAAEVYSIGMQAARENGLPDIKRKHIGHGIGIDMYEPPSISPNETLSLEAGMVFELEVLFYELGFGSVQVEDTIHVTPDGYERFTTLPHSLIIIDN
ncbi:Xaa-Pro dipeptidase, putative [Microscilla marina ATCC 23134]|uniref:Xaa-Pro dipeptidase, putative n=2 Tax=Microscilla marina TaxID=1027 RepID=A1ZGW8_MICM2|nr:Xaa-Pro dipeptidase, putative [Microscilla marina ATCC 23134]